MLRGHDNPDTSTARPMPMKQKMAISFKSLLSSAKKLTLGDDGSGTAGQTASTPDALFARTTPETDGPECERDCDACTVHYPRNFKIDEDDVLYGHVKGFATHAIVATGKSDWVRDVEDEKGSVMQAVGKAAKPSNGRLMLSASNIPTPHHSSDYSEPTTVLLLPAFTIIENVTPPAVPALIAEFVDKAPTTDAPLGPVTLPRTVGGSADNTTAAPAASEAATDSSAKAEAEADTKAENIPAASLAEDAVPTSASPSASAAKLPPSIPALTRRPCPHSALILLCSQKTRDARCGQSAPLLRRELERLLRPLGLFRDLDDERPGGVGIYFISHVGGHKYSANAMVYRRPDAFGLDGEALGGAGDLAALRERVKVRRAALPEEEDVGAAQCIWLARIRPEDCENLVRYTVLQGKVVKPDSQLRGGFDRAKGLMSW